VFTFEELTTVVCRVEAILNSRPLVSKPEADQGNVVITPGHFLIGDSLMSDPEPPEIKLKIAKRYEIVRRTIATLWRLWSKDYLSQLQSRNKWKFPEPNVLAGAIVILRNDSAAPCDWKLGKIVEVFPDSNNHVRTVDVRVSSGKIKRRAISSIVLLPGCSNAE